MQAQWIEPELSRVAVRHYYTTTVVIYCLIEILIILLVQAFLESLVSRTKNTEEVLLPPEDITFEVRIETDLKVVYKLLQKTLQVYKDEKRGPTLLAIQSTMSPKDLQQNIPSILDFPVVPIHVQVSKCSIIIHYLLNILFL